MKTIYKFCSFSLVFLALIGCYYIVKVSYWAYDNRYQQTIPGREIYWAIDKSKKKTHKKKLVLGDSTGNQFFNNQEDDDSIYSLACNQAIGMVGHYILLHNFLEAGNRPDTVYMVLRPFSLANNLNDGFTYHYFLKTLYTDANMPMMTKTVVNQVKTIPYYWLCHFPTVQTSTWSPKKQAKQRDYSFISPISKEYITKIDSLSKEYGFEWKLVPTFVAERWKENIAAFDISEADEMQQGGKLRKYLSMIEFLPDSCFYLDRSHVQHPMNFRGRMVDKLSN